MTNKQQCCGTCKYCQHEHIWNEWFCFYKQSDHYMDYVDYDTACEDWEERK